MTRRYGASFVTRFKRRGQPGKMFRPQDRRGALSEELVRGSTVRISVASTASDGTPEQRLILAVLMDAIGILMCLRDDGARRSSRIVAEAHDWIFSDDTSWPYAFRNICEALDIDPNGLRRRLARYAAVRSDAASDEGVRGHDLHGGEAAWKDAVRSWPRYANKGFPRDQSLLQ